MERLLLSPDQVAEALGIGRSRTYALIAQGDLPSIRVGRLIRVPVDRLRAWIEAKDQRETDGVPTAR
jgi:excisionase family DNA binding protein